MAVFKLNNQQKITTGFKVPEHYFEDFSEKIMKQIDVEEQTKIISFTSHKRKTWLYAAAAILIMALMMPIYNNYKLEKELDSAEIKTYISYQSTISQYDLMNLLDNKDIEELDINLNLEKESVEDILINSPNLENYLTN